MRLTGSLQIVKFKGPGEEPLIISGQDRTIATLKSLIADLKQQVASITMRVDSSSEKAQKAIFVKNRVSALAALRSKKAAEASLAQRLDTLSQVEGVYNKIEQAVDQVTMLRVMQGSTGVLRTLHAEVGGVTCVENVVEKLREEMDKVDEIGSVIEAAGQEDDTIDGSAIDDELEALVRQSQLEDKEKEARRTRLRLANIESLEGVREAAQLPNQETMIEERPSEALAAGSADTSVVDAFDRMSLDESQAPNIENIQVQTRTTEALPSGIVGG